MCNLVSIVIRIFTCLMIRMLYGWVCYFAIGQGLIYIKIWHEVFFCKLLSETLFGYKSLWWRVIIDSFLAKRVSMKGHPWRVFLAKQVDFHESHKCIIRLQALVLAMHAFPIGIWMEAQKSQVRLLSILFLRDTNLDSRAPEDENNHMCGTESRRISWVSGSKSLQLQALVVCPC